MKKQRAKRTVSGREKNRRAKQSRAQWEKDNPGVAHALKRLPSLPRVLIGR